MINEKISAKTTKFLRILLFITLHEFENNKISIKILVKIYLNALNIMKMDF